jgi:hypothetical protein
MKAEAKENGAQWQYRDGPIRHQRKLKRINGVEISASKISAANGQPAMKYQRHGEK